MARMPRPLRGPITWTFIALFIAALGIPAAANDVFCDGGETITLPNGTIGCVHDPDSTPPAESTLDLTAARFSSTPETVACIDDGTSGSRIQALYVVASDQPDRSHEVIPVIRTAIAGVDDIFRASSEDADSFLTVRWVHDGDCVADVDTVIVPPTADDSFAATIDALADAGYDDAGRHYLAWVDANRYCGIAVAFGDDQPGQGNVNNGAYPLWARVDQGCWGRDGMVEAHELTHMLGAVQPSAPHATGNGHCTDERDIMCYSDAPGVQMDVVCPNAAGELLLDCNDDDYFDPDPLPGSYLDTHWNVARSAFLETITVADTPEKPVKTEPTSSFGDVDESNTFRADIEWLLDSGITAGCNPPANDRFCPAGTVTRGQMAAFLARGLDLEPSDTDRFSDDDDSPFEADIEKLAAAGITTGCNPDSFCPDEPVTRGQMAAFLARALSLPGSGSESFSDDDDSPFEAEIERLAEAGITTGCTSDRFCPDNLITRAQMAAFLRRALTR